MPTTRRRDGRSDNVTTTSKAPRFSFENLFLKFHIHQNRDHEGRMRHSHGQSQTPRQPFVKGGIALTAGLGTGTKLVVINENRLLVRTKSPTRRVLMLNLSHSPLLYPSGRRARSSITSTPLTHSRDRTALIRFSNPNPSI